MPVISNGNAMGERGGSSHSTERERGGGSHSTVEERGGSSSGDGVPVKDARATADEGGVRPDWGSEQVGCVVPFLWEGGRVTVSPVGGGEGDGVSPVGGGEGDGVSPVQMVVVPRVSRDSHYYRHSRKRRRGMLIKAAPDEEPEEEVCASPMCLLIRIDSLSLSLSL